MLIQRNILKVSWVESGWKPASIVHSLLYEFFLPRMPECGIAKYEILETPPMVKVQECRQYCNQTTATIWLGIWLSQSNGRIALTGFSHWNFRFLPSGPGGFFFFSLGQVLCGEPSLTSTNCTLRSLLREGKYQGCFLERLDEVAVMFAGASWLAVQVTASPETTVIVEPFVLGEVWLWTAWHVWKCDGNRQFSFQHFLSAASLSKIFKEHHFRSWSGRCRKHILNAQCETLFKVVRSFIPSIKVWWKQSIFFWNEYVNPTSRTLPAHVYHISQY